MERDADIVVIETPVDESVFAALKSEAEKQGLKLEDLASEILRNGCLTPTADRTAADHTK